MNPEKITKLQVFPEPCIYETEKDLYLLLKKIMPDIRILGSDYLNKNFTAQDLNIKIYYHNRNHDFSTSNLRKKIIKN